jgi:hypothetical protein
VPTKLQKTTELIHLDILDDHGPTYLCEHGGGGGAMQQLMRKMRPGDADGGAGGGGGICDFRVSSSLNEIFRLLNMIATCYRPKTQNLQPVTE